MCFLAGIICSVGLDGNPLKPTAISAFKKNFLTVGVACWLPDPAVSMSHAYAVSKKGNIYGSLSV